MKRLLTALIVPICFIGFCNAASGAPINLSDWTVDNSFNFSGGQGAGVWTVQGGGTSVLQSVNSDSTMFLNPVPLSDIGGLSGTFFDSDSDNDFIGFVFGFQNTGSFYLFDWKQGDQNYYGVLGSRGITLKRFDAAPTTQAHLWSTASVPGIMTQLYHNDVARANDVSYTFELDRVVSSGEISIALKQGATILDSFTVFDSTYTSGKFGFYNLSEKNVTYSGFEADTLTVVPEPSSIVLFSIGAIGLIGYGYRRKRKQAA